MYSKAVAQEVSKWPTFRSRIVLVAKIFLGLVSAVDVAGQEPWEIWGDLHRLALIHPGDQVLLRGSHCPSGCRYDRHSAGDWRYIRVDGDEGVIFEEAGAGAITRIWMTMGAGMSQPLEPSVRLRIYLDGAAAPSVDVALPDLFNGSTPPFVPPVVGSRLDSSGGNFSYVPIPYRDGCRVTLTGADEQRIWFQFSFHRLAEPGSVTTFDPATDLTAWQSLLGAAGDDPWTLTNDLTGSTSSSGALSLGPGQTANLGSFEGPDSLTALILQLAESSWESVELRLDFDGEERVRMPLTDFFAIGRGGDLGTRSLLVGVAADGSLYAYFPMPFFQSAVVALTNLASSGVPIPVAFEIRRANQNPQASSGLFGAEARWVEETPIGLDVPLVELEGQGKWIGLFAELGSVDTLSREYLEGDERVFIDDSPHPMIYGTGTEDLFNGGFYFDQGPFRRALHGSPYHFVENGEDVTAAYRLALTDGVTFASRLRAGLEGGSTANVSLRARTVAYYYQSSEPGLYRWDVLDLGDPASRAAHVHDVTGPYEIDFLDAQFEGEPAQNLLAMGAYRPPGEERFQLRSRPEATRLRLRRRLDAGFGGQEAQICIGETVVGRFPPEDVNEYRRWREVDIDLPSSAADSSGIVDLTILALPNPGTSVPEESTFTSFRYELWADVPTAIFSDGFESGETSAWTSTVSP